MSSSKSEIAMPRVGVVIVTWNKKDYVLKLLDSLFCNPYPNWHIWIVDNASTDQTRAAVIERFPQVTYIFNSVNLGGTGGFNTGLCALLRQTGLDYVWLLDNDVEVEPGALAVLVETLERRPDAAVAGSHMIQMDRPEITNEIGADVDLENARLVLRHFESPAWSHRDEVYEVDYVAACSLLVRWAALQRVGIWDDLFIHYDDVDWCLRIKAAGWKVLACAASRIRHMSANVKRVTWILYYDVRNIVYLQHKYLEFRLRRWLKYLAMFGYFAMRDELGGKSYYSQIVELALIDFFAGRMGKRDNLPALETRPFRETLDRLLAGPTGTRIVAFEPAQQPVFTAADLETARQRGIAISGVSYAREERCTALPASAPRRRLPPTKFAALAELLRMAFLQPRSDYFILDIDHVCSGLFGLATRNIVLRVDDKCLIVPGGWARVGAALRWPLRWLRIGWFFLVFLVQRRARQNGAAQTPAEFEKKLTEQGCALAE